jgi:HK97 family phage portal protein
MGLLTLLQRATPKVYYQGGGALDTSLWALARWQEAMRPGSWSTVTGEFPWYYCTEEEALGLPVIAGFMSITSSLLLQMPLIGYRTLPDGSQQPISPTPPILANPAPAPGRTFVDFITEYLHSMILYGNYVAILGPKNTAGWPEMMLPIPMGQWNVQADQGRRWYTINGVEFTPDQVLHVMMNKAAGDLVGKGALQLYKRLIASSVAAEKWAATYFEGGAVPPGVVKHPNPELTQAQADALKLKMKAVAQEHEWAVVPGGTELEVLNSNAEESQLNETRKLNAQQLAMAMGIPGALLGLDSPSLTYRNITDVFQQFLTTTVMSYIVPLEQQLSSQCLPRTTQARFNQAAVLRPDMAARVDLATKAIASGLMTVPEARAFFALDVVAMGDTVAEPQTEEQAA